MPRVAIAVTKERAFQGQLEQWANVYHYDVDGTSPLPNADGNDLIDDIVAAEKAIHAPAVAFKTARVWETGGTPAENETLIIRDLTGNGSMTAAETNIWQEACVVVAWDTGRNTSTGRKIYLRKFVHSGGLPTVVGGTQTGQAALTAAQKGPFTTYGQNIRVLTLATAAVQARLEAPGGQNADTAPVSVLDYLHTRQFRRRKK